MKLLSIIEQLNEDETKKRKLNLTPEEQYHLYGDIKGDACIELLDAKQKLDNLKSLSVTDVISSFPDEDFLDRHIESLEDIIDNLNKSPTKEKLKKFLETLEELKTEINQSSEYGVDEIRKFLKRLD
jgi:hypothetical protein